jgi:hypothetical protein
VGAAAYGAAKAAFLKALRDGARRDEAAEAADFSLIGFYGAGRRDPAFTAQWKEGSPRRPTRIGTRAAPEGGEASSSLPPPLLSAPHAARWRRGRAMKRSEVLAILRA